MTSERQTAEDQDIGSAEGRNLEFPSGFLWGATVSAHQAEGGNVRSDWSEWERQPGRIADGTVAGAAADHYRLYREDIALVRSLGHNAASLSVDWGRIEPEDGQWNWAEIVHYRRVLEEAREQGVVIALTVWDSALPKWLARRGGWEWLDAPERFARFVRLLADEYGDLVSLWLTFDDPIAYAARSGGAGVWPPGRSSLLSAVRILFALARAHRLAYRGIRRSLGREMSPAAGRIAPMVGASFGAIAFRPAQSGSRIDSWRAALADFACHRLFFALTRISAHDFIGVSLRRPEAFLPAPAGIGNLVRSLAASDGAAEPFCEWAIGFGVSPVVSVLEGFARRGKPIFVTGHGTDDSEDLRRPGLIVRGLLAVHQAIRSGADVRGYFHRSLLDGHERELGFSARFGLVAVDFPSGKRTPRRSAHVYAEICRRNALPHYLRKFACPGVRW